MQLHRKLVLEFCQISKLALKNMTMFSFINKLELKLNQAFVELYILLHSTPREAAPRLRFIPTDLLNNLYYYKNHEFLFLFFFFM
jgi:hypothetical protein